MTTISLFNVGLVSMLFFVLASNVLNYVAISTNAWTEDTNAGLWYDCIIKTETRSQCFKENPPALIATGTALNALSLVLIVISQLALCLLKFRNTIAMYFVIGSFLTTLLSLVFNAVGWFFIINPAYQQLVSGTDLLSFKFGYSFWLMTPSFGCSIIGGLIGAAILGCTCVSNKAEREKAAAAKQETKL